MTKKCADGGNHDWRKVHGGKCEVCVKCNLSREIKQPSKEYLEYLKNFPLNDPRD